MKRLVIALLCVLMFAGCGGDESSGGGPPQPPAPVPPIGRLVMYLLAANSPGDSIDIFEVSAADGSLVRTANSPLATNAGILSLENSPGSPFVYAGSFTSNEILGFAMDGNTGRLTPLAGFPVTSEPENNIILDRTGQFLYSLGEDGIDGFRVDQTTGALTRLTGFPIRGLTELRNGSFDLDNNFLYVADFGADEIVTYQLNGRTGALTDVAHTPTGDQPFALEVEPANSFVYVSVADGFLNGFRRNADGSLSQLAGFPVSYAPAGAATARFAFRDQVLFIGDRTSRSLSAFSVDPATGGVTLLAGYPKPGGGADIVSYPVPNAPFLYAADRPANLINGFQIGPNASTTSIPGSPFPAGGGPNELLPVVFAF
ncbi:MAG: hypothetical protein AMXMBFR33_14160 [Candidatus Xenobia bacterium]